MRTSWTLFVALIVTLWKCWGYVPGAALLAEWIGFVVLVSSLSYYLARYIWAVCFVKLVDGRGKAVLITGCDTGFGHLLAKNLARLGFHVYAGCLDGNSDGARELRKIAEVKVLQLDVCSDKEVNDAATTIKADLGSKILWAVVCNAGIRNDGLLEWISMDSVKKVVDVNLLGTCRVAKTFLPLLRKAKGRLVVVTSGFAYVTMPMGTPYSFTKHALVSMLDGLRRECRGKTVDIISVIPQAYKTNITAELSSARFTMEDLRKKNPEVAEDFTQEEIDDWFRTSKEYFDVLNRDNIQEVVDVMLAAVRETHPKTGYPTPVSASTAVLFPLVYLPDEVSDALIALGRKDFRNILPTWCKSKTA